MTESRELPPAIAALVAEAREDGRPSEADRQRVWTALSAAIQTGGPTVPPVPSGTSASSHGAPGAGAAGSAVAAGAKGTLAKVAVGLALAGAVGAGSLWYGASGSQHAPVAPRADIRASQTIGQPVASKFAQATPAPEAARIVAPAVVPEIAADLAADTEAPPSPGTVAAPSAAPATQQIDHKRATTSRAMRAPELIPAITPSNAAAPVAQTNSVIAPVATAAPPELARPSLAPVGPTGPGPELRLIRAAAAALRDGVPARALALLDEHAARFGTRAILAEERAGLRVLALCASDQRAQGLRERAQFLARTPESPMAARVRGACGNAHE